MIILVKAAAVSRFSLSGNIINYAAIGAVVYLNNATVFNSQKNIKETIILNPEDKYCTIIKLGLAYVCLAFYK